MHDCFCVPLTIMDEFLCFSPEFPEKMMTLSSPTPEIPITIAKQVLTFSSQLPKEMSTLTF